MKKTTLYHYLGTNGTIVSPVYLKDAYSVKQYRLEADADKMLTKDDGATLVKSVTIPEEDLELWKEVYNKVSS